MQAFPRLPIHSTSGAWRAGSTRPRYRFTVACWSTITSDSIFMLSSCREHSEMGRFFLWFAPTCVIATICNRHCNTCVAQPIRVMTTWRGPHLPPVYHRQFGAGIQHIDQSLLGQLAVWQYPMRVALVKGTNQTSRDTSWRQPCNTCWLIVYPARSKLEPMSRAGKVLRVVSN